MAPSLMWVKLCFSHGCIPILLTQRTQLSKPPGPSEPQNLPVPLHSLLPLRPRLTAQKPEPS